LGQGGAVRVAAHAEPTPNLPRNLPRNGCRIIPKSPVCSRGLPCQRTDMLTSLRKCTGLGGIVECAEKRVGQSDGTNVSRVRILGDRRIDPEAEWELHLLAGRQSLLVEAEAGRLVEVLA